MRQRRARKANNSLTEKTAGVRDPQSFDHLAEFYDRFAVLAGDELHGWLSLRLPPAPADRGGIGPAGLAGRALDAGCGTGVHTALLAGRYGDVLAVDPCPPMVEHARARRPGPNVRYQVRDLRDVHPGTDGLFDVVFCAYTLHHLLDLYTALQHVRSLIRPGGTVLVVDVVDERMTVPRSWFRRQAWREFVADVARKRRPVRTAVRLLRCNLDPAWLDHQTTDRLHPPEVWDQIAREVLPGASITGLYRARALSWQAPDRLAELTALTQRAAQ